MDNVTIKMTVPNKALQRLEIASKLVMVIYSAFMAWQMAKVVCPQLEVHEKILVERVQRKFRREKLTERQAVDFVAEVTHWAREQE